MNTFDEKLTFLSLFLCCLSLVIQINKKSKHAKMFYILGSHFRVLRAGTNGYLYTIVEKWKMTMTTTTATTRTTNIVHLLVVCKSNKGIKSMYTFNGSIPKVSNYPAERPSHPFLPQLNEISSLNTLQSSKLLLLLLFGSPETSFPLNYYSF